MILGRAPDEQGRSSVARQVYHQEAMLQTEDCIFCQIASRRAPAYVLDETGDLIVFLSLENHPLVVPTAFFIVVWRHFAPSGPEKPL